MPLPSVFQGVQDCRLTGLKPSKRFRRPPRQQLLQLHALRSVFQGVQACRLPARKTPQMLPPCSYMLPVCFSGSSRLPFDRPETLQTLPQASEATTLTPTCPCHLFFREFKPAVCQPAKPPKCSPAAPNLHAPAELLHLHAPAICFSGGSRLPFARPQTPQTLPQASKATTLTATCPCHLFFREFKTAV